MIRDDVFALAVMAVVFLACTFAEALTKPVATWDDDAIDRRMAEAQTDDHLCDACGRVSVVRELVTEVVRDAGRVRERSALLLCARCADAVKVQHTVVA